MMRIFLNLLKQKKKFTSDQLLIDNIIILIFTKTNAHSFSRL